MKEESSQIPIYGQPMKTTNLIAKMPALIVAALTSTLHAQSTAFTYQGQLTDNGLPANGFFDITFSVWTNSSGAAQVGDTITNLAVPVSDGLLSTRLDFGAAVFDGSERWLEIGVVTNGGSAFNTLSPRQRITSTPYAIQSVNAASALNVSGSVSAEQLTGTISSNNISAGSITSVMLAAGAVGSNQLASGAVTADALADDAVTAAKMATVSNWFALTVANPWLTTSDRFGWSVAAVGTDRVLIGANDAIDAGAAYLLNTDGTLLTTFTNPTPAAADDFGHSVAAVGTNQVLIGADGDNTGASSAGAAYLFSTDGTLLTTFTNPTPAASDYFGRSVAAAGSDQVLIGAYRDDTGAPDAGAAYLFDTNGALLTTFTNPTPADSDFFGVSMAPVGTDRVLIGAYRDDTGASAAGAAYLFSTNGALLITFTNPTPVINGYFGNSIAVMGGDRVLIGARGDGAADIFSTNGALLMTFTNPISGGGFGISMAAVGSDRVLIGAYQDDTGAVNAGVAYLFSTNGALLTTFTNPAPAEGDWFAFSVAAVGNDRVLMGAPLDDLGTTDAGTAYLFSVQTFTTGLVAEAVAPRSVSTASLKDGAVTLAKLDPTIGVWTRSGEDVFRMTGNVGIGTANPTNRLQVAGNVSATAFITTSDRNSKENLAPVSPLHVLSKVTALPISTWNFKESKDGRHMGPMAQDFKAVFDLGHTDNGIATVDADGVALAAIQGLNEKVEGRRKKSEIRIQKLEAENAELKARLEKLEQLMNHRPNGGAK